MFELLTLISVKEAAITVVVIKSELYPLKRRNLTPYKRQPMTTEPPLSQKNPCDELQMLPSRHMSSVGMLTTSSPTTFADAIMNSISTLMDVFTSLRSNSST